MDTSQCLPVIKAQTLIFSKPIFDTIPYLAILFETNIHVYDETVESRCLQMRHICPFVKNVRYHIYDKIG